ncbi:DUF1643 domain-containing protein [Pelagibacterium montanilacus]|uniref:DUF1643 domain-containing protein n=1 Tax=Pelagibacterium montanilacus TaxID=2185280 RepID=UPI000F8DBED8|nr:DUF1643 domain-containing protein [Pelagibacterium montanilacus]
MDDLLIPAFDPASFSPCRTWRYRLERRWAEGPVVGFILLNPSTADESNDDPTIRRCIGYAKAWGFGGLVLGNIFALRSTDPANLYLVPDPIGPDNNVWLRRIVDQCGTIVCGWGRHGESAHRGDEVIGLVRSMGRTPKFLRLTKSGQPGHPLYLPSNLVPQDMPLP